MKRFTNVLYGAVIITTVAAQANMQEMATSKTVEIISSQWKTLATNAEKREFLRELGKFVGSSIPGMIVPTAKEAFTAFPVLTCIATGYGAYRLYNWVYNSPTYTQLTQRWGR
jgi:hypothetical protein